ncbi:hypothetical protein FF38_12584 [Lucilia cuprina]|uniref:Uncharacterized protein n=1 Tax=Lucilia cuprina TaxID=7375 RepID=A0A0L0BMT6_LUCCU|nr:hypothetical protein FF38_12584 [Lucilia cuprina]
MKVKVDSKTNISKLKTQDKTTVNSSTVINSSKTDLDEQENNTQITTAPTTATINVLKDSSSLSSVNNKSQIQLLEEEEEEPATEVVETFDILPHFSTTRNNNLINSIHSIPIHSQRLPQRVNIVFFGTLGSIRKDKVQNSCGLIHIMPTNSQRVVHFGNSTELMPSLDAGRRDKTKSKLCTLDYRGSIGMWNVGCISDKATPTSHDNPKKIVKN